MGRLRVHAALFVPLSVYRATIGGSWPDDVQIRLGAADCSQGIDFDAQVAYLPEQQAQGYSERVQPLGASEAMIFAWDSAEPKSFWMKDTLIPLTLLYFGADSRLSSSFEMPVEPDPADVSARYPSVQPVIAAVETAEGNASRFAPGTEICVLK